MAFTDSSQRLCVMLFAAIVPIASAPAAELPIPCISGACGASVPGFVSSGIATAVQSGNALNINQSTPEATLNWRSFNISSDGTVTFTQPDAASVALNRIFQADPSRILGALNANGRIFLINQNGIVFGEGAKVNVAGLLASSLNLTPEALADGITQAARQSRPAFEQFRDASGAVLPSGAVVIERGATIDSAAGQVLVFAPEVVNRGTIRTPDGQTILAAGDSVYLLASEDPNLRGLLVEVDTGGTVTNGTTENASAARPEDLVGQIIAERGNVTLAGLAVNQQGRISATTSVRFNGSVRLQARDGAAVQSPTSAPQLTAARGGQLTLGERSSIDIKLDANDTERAVDVNAQRQSSVTLSGDQIRMLDGASILATSGVVEASAEADPGTSPNFRTASRIYVAPGARIDVSGADIEAPMEANVLSVELRGNELRDSPEQRDGVLRGQRVTVDLRRSGTRADGSRWEGTPLADLAGNIDTIQRSVGERSLLGGTISLQSQGDVITAPGSSFDVSGGTVRYRDGYINTTQLVSNGRVYDIGDADPARTYDAIAGVFTVSHPRWGLTQTFAGIPSASQGQFTPGYVEGKDAGSLSIVAPSLVLDGDFIGTATAGPLQRLPTDTAFAATTRLYRPQDQLPLAGRLIIGDSTPAPAGGAVDYIAPSLRFGAGALLPTLTNASGAPFDPLVDPFPAQIEALLRPSTLGADRMGSLQVFSNGRVTVPIDVQFDGGDAAELALTAHQVDFLGSFVSTSGRFSLEAVPTSTDATPGSASLVFGPAARVDLRGRWVNDNQMLGGPAAAGPRLINGGSARFAVTSGALDMASGSLVDLSAGAWRRADGVIIGGRGGSASISASSGSTASAAPIEVGTELRAFALTSGGSLAFAANAACIAELDCTDGRTNELWLTPDVFGNGGFASYSVTSNRDGLRVLSGTQIRPRLESLELVGDQALTPSGTDFASLTRQTQLLDTLRAPVNLSLRTAITGLPGGGAFTRELFDAAGSLDIGRNALFDMDPGAQLALRSSTRLLFDGEARAPAGRISLELDTTLDIAEFLSDQAIWLGSSARLAAPGVVRLQTSDRGLQQGDVLAGGTVSMQASRGYVVTDPSADIDISGTAADLDIRSASATGFERRRIASNGGRLQVFAAEGALLNGSVDARGGDGTGAYGGEFSLELSTALRGGDPGAVSGINLLPGGARTLRLQQTAVPLISGYGLPIADSLNGIGATSVAQLRDAGFASVALAARNTFDYTGIAVRSFGTVEFSGPIDMAVAQRLVLDAPALTAGGGDVRLTAPYLALGSTDRRTQASPDATPGAARLQVSGDLIDLIGTSSLRGFASADVRSAGDVRLRGVQLLGLAQVTDQAIQGAWRVPVTLQLIADQVYPTTLSRFTLSSADSVDGLIRIEQGAAGGAGTVLSAGGTLRLQASRIEQAGTLRAPFGSIELLGDQIVLEPGSLTSTSAEGATIPFGRTQGGFDWVYEFTGAPVLFGAGSSAIPQQRVALSGASVAIESGAIVDVSGGGDYFATEFVPGVGGSRDLLAASVRPNTFAIVPGLDFAFAPYDQLEYTGSSLLPGDSVFLSGVAGLPAGTYALLPARYALLPGAFLVSEVSGYRDIAATESFAQLDGSTVISGFRTFAGSDQRETRTRGFAVRSGTDILNEARYVTTSATDFFADQALALDVATPRLPIDSGVLALSASAALQIDGSLRAAAKTSGRGAAVDISSPLLRVVAAAGQPTLPGFVDIVADSLNRLGAESLLIGGSRALTGLGTQINVGSEGVVVDQGASLRIPEATLVARGEVTVAQDAEVSAEGAVRAGEVEQLNISGDGALLRVSTGPQVRIARTQSAGATGTLNVLEGAVIGASGSVALDASRDARSSGELRIDGGSLNLGASRISLGDTAGVTDGLVLSNTQLAGLGLEELVLTSRSSVDVFGAASLDVNRLVFDTSGILGFGSGAATLRGAESIVLSNSAAATSPSVGTGSGTLTLSGGTISLESGRFDIGGFSDVTLAASEQITAAGSDLAIAGGLTLAGARIESLTGAVSSISAAGQLLIRPALTGQTTAAQAAAVDNVGPALGGLLRLSGRSVESTGLIELRSGVVELRATGSDANDSVVLRSGSTIDVSGQPSMFDGVPLATAGGNVRIVAASGDVRQEAGAHIRVGAPSEGQAGTISVSAPLGDVLLEGQLSAGSGGGAGSGSFELDAWTVASLDGLNRLLNGGGFGDARSFRQRGPGDLVVSSDATAAIRAQEIALIADQGAIRVQGRIEAIGESGGRVRLQARDDVEVSGSIDARATGTDGRGGRVALSSSVGAVRLLGTSSVDLTAGVDALRPGRLDIRVSRAGLNQVLDGDPANDGLVLAGAINGAGRIEVEGFQSYVDADGVLSAAEVANSVTNPRFADASAFMLNAALMQTALGRADDPAFRIVPGVEIRSAGDLRVSNDWNLFGWRFGGLPGVLTLRAAGDLLVDRSISDGFGTLTGAAAFLLPTAPTESWSYRLVAGADVNSADFLAVLHLSDLAAGKGSLRVAAGVLSTSPTTPSTQRMIRTGSGSIDIAAGRDLVLGNRASTIYTAGTASGGIALAALGNRAYPDNGGDISISVGGSIAGAQTNQLVTDWLWRAGRLAPPVFGSSATGWTVNFGRFEQNVGALGGGDVRVRAQGDIRDFSAVIPSIGRQEGGTSPESSRVAVVGGGDLSIKAGGVVAGGAYYVGSGIGTLRADQTAQSVTSAGIRLYPVLALGDASFDVLTRDDLGIETIVNPTIVSQGRSQTGATSRSVFSTYASQSRASLASSAGSVTLNNNVTDLALALTSVTFAVQPADERTSLRVYPPTLRAVSHSADLNVNGSMTLFPDPVGNLELFAARDLSIADRNVSTAGLQVIVSDADPDRLPSVTAPGSSFLTFSQALSSVITTSPLIHATTPVHADSRQPDGGQDLQPVRLVARSGDLAFVADVQTPAALSTPKATRLVAGRDIRNLSFQGQNLRDTDVTSVVAGRDLIYPTQRDAANRLIVTPFEISLSGPGTLEVRAGRNIDLQTAGGITTTGNLTNPALPDGGAKLSLSAGLGAEGAKYDAFTTKYLEQGSEYDDELLEYVARQRGSQPASKSEALAYFRLLDDAHQAPLLEQVYFAEIRASGRAAAAAGNSDFTRAFDAIETMFPGANPDVDAGEQNPYRGDLGLFFSRLSTLDGGDVSMFVPGGTINVGLASPPAAFGVNKEPFELGIVAQSVGDISAFSFSDFQVNESRVFAADGGNILVWSTRGDIDAGRGAKTAISAPPPVITIDENGRSVVQFPAALTGSGIQTLATSPGRAPGDVDLFAPRGVVNAGDAGIVAGNLTIAATAVLGANNISVSGSTVGVPVDTGGLAAGLTGVSNVASSASSAATASIDAGKAADEGKAPLAETALGWLEVFVLGFGEEVCKDDDIECLKRNQQN